jgi:hypothetical protein
VSKKEDRLLAGISEQEWLKRRASACVLLTQLRSTTCRDD